MFPENPLDRWRLLPLNQLAALKLKEAGEPISSENLPALQLMTWGLTHGAKPTHRRTAQELLRLQYRGPDEAFICLTSGSAEELLELQGQLIKLSPKSAAQRLLDVFDRCLKGAPGKLSPRG